MIKKLIPLLIVVSLFIGYPASTFAATTTTPVAKTTVATKVVKKKVVAKKKKKAKRKEKLTLAPAPFTLDNAPHSPKPLARSKSKSKKTTKKKA